MPVLCVCLNPTCHKSFTASAYRVQRGLVKYCSRQCAGEIASAQTSTRFWNRVAVCAHGWECPYCCHVWTGFRNKGGYGIFPLKEDGHWNNRLASRMVWALINNRPIPAGLNVLHHCDNPPCTNLYHIYLGTHKQNTTDAKKRKRLAVGEQRSHLREQDIADIHLLYQQGAKLRELAEQFQLDGTSIGAIVHGKTWQHIERPFSEEQVLTFVYAHRQRGASHSRAKLTEEQVRSIRTMRTQGISARALAQQFQVSLTQIKDILRRKSWKHLP